MLLLAIPQIPRGPGRDIQQAGVLLIPLHLVVRPGQRLFKVVADVLVELLVLLVLDIARGPGPERGGAVDLLPLPFTDAFLFPFGRLLRLGFLPQLDRNADVIGILADHRAQAPVVEELALLFLQMEDHVGAA